MEQHLRQKRLFFEAGRLRLKARRDAQIVNVLVLGKASFFWPALEIFMGDHGGSVNQHFVDSAREDVDLAVRHGDASWAGLHVERLCSEQLFPVCSPKLVKGRRRLGQPCNVLKFPMLHLEGR